MKITEYLNRCPVEFLQAKKISRIVDIYPSLYSEYSEELVKPLTRQAADSNQIVAAFEALTPYMGEVRILNSLLKLLGLMEKDQHKYMRTETFQLAQNKIMMSVSNLCS